MLTDFHKEMLQEVLSVRDYYLEDSKAFDRIYYDWRSKEFQEFQSLQNYRVETGKNYIKNVIIDWLDGIEATIRFEGFSFKNEYSKIYIGAIGLTNNVGAIDGCKSNVLNKVYLMRPYYSSNKYIIRSHKARTDKNYLKPFDDRFCEFFQNIMDYLNE